MTTLIANTSRAYELGNRNNIPAAAASVVFEGAAVGVVKATGLARALVSGDTFVGFAERKADNSAGAAAALYVDTIKSGQIELLVPGAAATDIGQPVYASDDNAFTFNPVSAVFVGVVKRIAASGVAVIDFDAGVLRDPYGDRTVREAVINNTTLGAQDSGKLLWVVADGISITLPPVASGVFGVQIVNGGAYGSFGVTLSPDPSDYIAGPDIVAADDKDLINTKATAQRGDSVVLYSGDADGYLAGELRGVWARQP